MLKLRNWGFTEMYKHKSIQEERSRLEELDLREKQTWGWTRGIERLEQLKRWSISGC